ncbi:MAG: hypothetical protein A2V88_17360 [Elusimicrobia bacterium RBG_16_66_12]|nr:MAG: hypothetical protein A2V88_17360 [Elusimicrobia bacterium RBG_16_66_12]
MRIKTALNILFEAAVTMVCFTISWSTYGHASRADAARSDTNAMATAFFIAGSISLLMLIRSFLALRQRPK